MALIKLTVTKTNQMALININRIESVMPDAVGSSVLLVDSDTPFKVNESQEQIERMVLRDQFAVSALNGLLSNSGGVVQANSYSGTGYANGSAEYTALWAYELADAMLEERGKCTN